ncbi:MAG: DUF4124 domain-containing protein [Hahellaceae bacterium]|nr:DUF4124 domain-containing protein [Hahellaceae bacterium]MCP5212684.1 DUF4124 domain-containing protein [Hahellaceae bacterium]
MIFLKAVMLVVLLGASGTEAKVYKWVDEQGVVHFTQTPPVQQQTSGNLQTLEVNTGRISPRFRDGRQYCGSQAIPDGDSDIVRYLILVKMQLSTYRENLAYVRQNHPSGQDKNERVDEYKCLIGWAESELQKNDRQLQDLRAEYYSLSAQFQDASGKKQQDCPQFEGWLVGEDAEKWASCDRTHSRDMSEAKKRMKQLLPLVEE